MISLPQVEWDFRPIPATEYLSAIPYEYTRELTDITKAIVTWSDKPIRKWIHTTDEQKDLKAEGEPE